MRGWVYGVILGLTIALGIIAVYEVAGGDATLVVLLILLATYVGVRLNRVEGLFEDMIAEIREAQAECGDVFPAEFAGQPAPKVCTRRAGHADPWHGSPDGTQWLHTKGPGGGGGGRGARLGDTEPTP